MVDFRESHGFIIGHITPEANTGGILSIIQNDDLIEINAKSNELNLLVNKKEIKKRFKNNKNSYFNIDKTSYLFKYSKLVTDASQGCIT